jgi:hypothetical protein
LESETPECLRVDFQPSRLAWEYGHGNYEGERPKRTLVRFDTASRTIHTYPLRTAPSLSTLGPKYGPVSEIAFEDFTFVLPNNEVEIEEQLGGLPEQFYTQCYFGLGVKWQLRPIVNVLARNHFRRLLISRTRNTSVENLTLVMSENDVSDIAYEMNRIATRFARQSRRERARHAYNEVLAKRFPAEFRRDDREYGKGMLVSFLRAA